MADTPTVTITVEGRPVSVPAGSSILEAAKRAGVLIPHYCYHPTLPVAGNCRMCLVEVEKMPKLAPACATAVSEGQVIHVHTEKAREARKGVLELLLINHPLDCPICDASGECELQDYTFMEGPKETSLLHDPKRFNPVEDFGGDVLYVTNRCILCTRCVRFMDAVAQDPVLNVSERGDRAVIGKFEGQDLTHAWAANVIDLCPVGALVSKDFLNKARTWDLDRSASICPNCSQGCNSMLETRDNAIVRMRPRPNDDVNRHFLCDHGRLNYRWMNRQDRVEAPLVRRTNGALQASDWDIALPAAAALLKDRRSTVIASPMLSNEALFLLHRLLELGDGRGVFHVQTGPEAPLPGVEDLALRADRAANVAGAELLGFTRTDDPLGALQDGDVLVVADDELIGVAPGNIARAGAVIVIGTTLPETLRAVVSVVLPITNFAEEEGTFTNLRGRVQRFQQAKAGPGIARPSWWVIGDLLTALGEGEGYFLAADAFAALASTHPQFTGLSYASLGLRGAIVAGADALAAADAGAQR
ncbi:MAG: NADH-quinone oxidoreductase subunit G [Gemmatimonadaceae bacterium]